MFRAPAPPAWQRDVVWLFGLVGVVATTVAIGAFAWWRLADVRNGPDLIASSYAQQIGVLLGAPGPIPRPGTGGSIEIVPGSGVTVPVDAVLARSMAETVDLIAGRWTDVLHAGGREALETLVVEPTLRDRVIGILDTAVVDRLTVELDRAFLEAGVFDGSRQANWPLQAARTPGAPVVPIVGIDMSLDPVGLDGVTTAQVGAAVVDALVDAVVEQGAPAARAVFSAPDLAERFDAAIDASRDATVRAFAVALAGEEATIAAFQRIAGRAAPHEGAGGTWWSNVDASGWGDPGRWSTVASSDEAVRVLAAEAWRQGSAPIVASIGDPVVRAVLASSAPVVDALSYRARVRAARAWTSAVVVAVVAVVGLAVLVRRSERPRWIGSVAVLSGGVGATVSVAWWWHLASLSSVTLAAPDLSTVQAHVLLALWAVGNVPTAWLIEVIQVHVAVASLGVLAWTFGTFDALGDGIRRR